MQLSQVPSQLVEAWATGDTTKTNPIPVPSQQGITPGAASYTDGFPPLCATPLASGGIPPSKADMNGILFGMSSVDVWMCAGGGFPYNSAFQTAIGGYPKGGRVLMASGAGYWVSTVDNNTTDPDTGGAGWATVDTNSITALTGDATATGPGSAALTLAASGVTAGIYTAANITVDAKGRVTAAANGAVFSGNATKGSVTLGGIIVNWVLGTQVASNAGEGTTQTLSWNTPFPTAVQGYSVSTVVAAVSSNMDVAWQALGAPNNSNINVYMNIFNEVSSATTAPYVLAIGN